MKKQLKTCINSMILVLFSHHAQADMLRSVPDFVHLHISPESGWAGHVGKIHPVASFAGFSENLIGHWLTLASAPEFLNRVGGYSTSFTGRLNNDRCEIINAPYSIKQISWDQRQDFYQLQTRRLNRCVQYRVRDISGIEPAKDQFACEVFAVNESEVIARGSVCYFKVNPKSSFSVQYELNPECTHEDNFQSLELIPSDMFAYTGYYLSGDATGTSSTLIPLGSGSVRLSIQPSSAQVKLSPDMGDSTPRWPVEGFPDLHMGEMKIRRSGSQTRLLTQLFFTNNCPEEQDTSCQFSSPVGAQFSIKELPQGGKEKLLDQWYMGSVSPALWQGFFPSQRELNNFEFKTGVRYRLEADLTYLSVYFRLFKEGFKDFLIQQGLWRIDPNSPLKPIPPIASLPGLDSLKPNLPLPSLNPLFPGGANDAQLQLNQMRALLNGIDWPPYFENLCGELGCANALRGQAKIKIGVDFTIDRFENDEASTKDYRVWRESSILPEYDFETQSIMKADCQ